MVSILCNPGIRPRHWEQMSEIAGHDLTPDSGSTLRKILKQNLTPYLELFESISAGASKVITLWIHSRWLGAVICREETKHLTYFFETVHFQEFALERAMHNMVEVWDTVSFHYHPYRDTGVSILSSVDEIQTMLDDQIVKTQTMRGSPFIKPFEAEIKVNFVFTDIL